VYTVHKVLFWEAKIGQIALYSVVFIAVFPTIPSAFKVRQKDAGKTMQKPGSVCFRELSKALKLAPVGIQPDCAFERLKSGDEFFFSPAWVFIRH